VIRKWRAEGRVEVRMGGIPEACPVSHPEAQRLSLELVTGNRQW
jgi:hypothetical protein